MALRKVAVAARGRGARRVSRRPGYSRDCAGGTEAGRGSPFPSTPRRSSAAASSTPTAPALPGAHCGSSRGRRAARSPTSRDDEVRTGPHGGFRLPLAAGPSRRITVSFVGEDGLDGSRRPGIALRVRGGLQVSASPGAVRTGQVVRFSGRVNARGAPIPRRGKLVAIQYYESAARSWRPVLFVRSDRSGHFRARYRFRYVSGSARIRFRAVALAEERWPYSTGASAPLVDPRQRLIGRGRSVGWSRCRRRPSTPAPGRSSSSCTTRTPRRRSRTSASSPPTASTTA